MKGVTVSARINMKLEEKEKRRIEILFSMF